MNLEPIVGRLIGDNTDYVRSLHDADRRTEGFADKSDRHFGRLRGTIGGVAALLGTLGAGVAIAGFFKGAIAEAEEARKVTAQTNAVIASTGGVARVSAGDVNALSDRLSALSGIDDEVIAGGQNLLLTFTNVRNEVGKNNDIFNQGTKAALNMSVALKQDLNSSTMLVGKALNDPIKGMTALTRSGIQFTEQQRSQVKAMVESGNVLGAQKIILKELETQFGGSAEAAASPLARLKVVVGNLQEEIGSRLLPVLANGATWFADKLPVAFEATSRALRPVIEFIRNAFASGRADTTWLDNLVGGMRALVGAFLNASDGITSSGFAGVMERIGIATRQVFDFIRDNAQPILIGLGATIALTVAPFAALAAGLIYAYTQFDLVRTVVDAVVRFLVDVVIPAVAAFASYVAEQFSALVGWVREHWASIQEAIGHVIAVVSAIVETFVGYVRVLWQTWGDEILNIARIVWDQIRNVVETAINLVRGIIETVVALINGDWGAAWDGIKGILATAWEFIRETVVNALRLLREAIEGGLSGIVAFLREVPGRILGALGNVGSLLWDAGWKIMMGLKDGIVAGLGQVKDYVVGIAGKIISWKGPLDYDKTILIPAGRAIMDSLVKGLRDHEGRLVDQLGHVTGLISSVGGNVNVTGSAGFGGQVVAGSAITGGAAGARGGNTYIFQITTATGVIPDEVMRQLRAQLFELENDMGSGQILPAA